MAIYQLSAVNPLTIPTRRSNPMLFPSAEGGRPPTPPGDENNHTGAAPTAMGKKNNTDSFDFSNSPKDKSSVLNLNKHFMASSQSLRKDKPTPPASPRLEKSSLENMSTDGEYASATDEPAEGEELTAPPPGNLSTIEFPFLRALHTFDPASLPNTSTEDPVSICLRFEQGDVALLHSVHDSGWGDATLLPTSRRGWIPTNYFTTYSDPKVAALLTAILNFVLNPKSLQISGKFDSRHTFSQEAITAIVAGVRSLLEACGTLTRDTATVKKSQMIRKFRKNLLAELAILVSLAKQHRNSTDEAVIERLVNGCYKIASKAVLFLDVWAMDNSNEHEYVTTNQRDSVSHHSPQNSVDTATAAMPPPPPPPGGSGNRSSMSTLAPSISQSTVVTPGTMLDSNEGHNNNFATPRAPRRTEKNANRESVIFLSHAPTAKQRLDEVNDALTAYLGIFIHRMGFLESDSSASTQILVNTRKSMLACRELLAAVESISFKQLPRNRELEQTKDKLFGQIRGLVTAARDVVANSAAAANSEEERAEISNAGKKLISIATDCARTAGECVVRCRIILDKVGDFQMPSDREYPDFSDGVIAIPNYRVRGKELSLIAPSYLNTPSPASPTFPNSVYNDMPQSAASETAPRTLEVPSTNGQPGHQDDENSSNMLPEIPSLSPIITAKSAETSPSEPTFQAGTTYLDPNDTSNKASGSSSSGEEAEAEEPEVVVDAAEYPADLQVIKDETTGKIRAGSLRVMIDMLTDENKLQDPFLLSTFFLTFRLYSTPQEVVDCLVDRYGIDIDEDQLVLQDLEDISSRRIKVYTMFKRWLESHWKQSIDGPVLEQILDLADNHFAKVLPNSKTIIHDLASKVTSDMLEDGEPIVPRVLSLPNGKPAKSGSGRDSIIQQSTLSKNMITALHRLNEVNGYKPWNSTNPLDSEESMEDEGPRRRDMGLRAATTNGTTNSFITNGHPPTQNHNASSADTRSIHTTASSTWSSSFRIVRNSTFNVSANAINPPPLTVMDFEPLEIAAQLTLMDSNMFAKLEPAELLGRNFEKKRKIRQAPHVAMMATFMNQLSSFVGHTVLGGDLPTKQRKNVLKQWIKIAEKCLELKNYNSLIGIVSVLQSVNIIRLKKTWETLSPRYHTIFNHLKEISSPERNFAGYRQQIRVQETPCVPFLGVYLSDLTFLVEGNARTRKFHHPDSPNKVIKVVNFDLYERISKIVAEIQKFQVPYTKLAAAKPLQTWLHGEMIKSHAQVSKGDELWRRSCIVEPKAH